MKRMGILSIACAAALTIACNGNARNDNNRAANDQPGAVGTAGEADRTAVHDSEKDFINKELSDGTAEVQLGKLASERAASADVKHFGQMMVEDHTKAGNELKAVAAEINLQPAPTIDDKHQDLIDKLSKLRGAAFDREYITAMVDDHQDAVDKLESRTDSTASLKDRVTNRDSANAQVVPEKTDNVPTMKVNEWAAKTLPTVRHHLDEAKLIDDKLDNSRRNDTARSNAPAPRDASHPAGKAKY